MFERMHCVLALENINRALHWGISEMSIGKSWGSTASKSLVILIHTHTHTWEAKVAIKCTFLGNGKCLFINKINFSLTKQLPIDGGQLFALFYRRPMFVNSGVTLCNPMYAIC